LQFFGLKHLILVRKTRIAHGIPMPLKILLLLLLLLLQITLPTSSSPTSYALRF
jgi:hypothetical protein